ncbi:hypothetical protein [Viridibacillus arvi]|uniref:hypothetical protein n=1 Tax=Viridibacillus arvi TaxID=263475 RepID=UPI003D28B04C
MTFLKENYSKNSMTIMDLLINHKSILTVGYSTNISLETIEKVDDIPSLFDQ